MCNTVLSRLDLGGQMFLLGNHFMRNFYVVFDRDNDRIGLAESVLEDE
jgi:hypothetical protein